MFKDTFYSTVDNTKKHGIVYHRVDLKKSKQSTRSNAINLKNIMLHLKKTEK